MGDFEIEDVLFFIISKGCRVKNHELVTHFRNFLNHPVNKVQNRDKFKNYVNELATVKIDEGDKILVLKKKYRPPSENYDSTSTAPPFPASQSGTKSAGAWVPKKTVRSEPDLSGGQPSSSNVTTTPPADIEDRLAQNDSLRAQSEPPSSVTGTSDADLDSTDGLAMSKVRSDESVEVILRHSDRLPAPAMSVEDTVSARSTTGSNTSLASADGSQKSLASSTSGVASMDEDANASVVSVKDKIMKLNKNISELDVNQPKSTSGSSNGGNKKTNKHTGADDDDTSHSSGSFATLDDEQKDWMVVCSHSDYHEMNRLLSKNPALAKIKDFTNTALHWAAKSGKSEVIKLVANKPGVNVDQRSHGYTALHLAAIHGQEEIIELLVQAYKADPNLRDYSGKKAKQYLKNSASSKAQQLLVSRRLGSDQSNVKILDDSFIRSASMRMSNRAKAMSSLLQFKSSVARQPILRSSWNGTSDEIYNDKDRHLKTPPSSAGSSPGTTRKKSSNDAYLMPPPAETGMRRTHQSSRVKSSSRDVSPSSRHTNGDSLNMVRSGSDPGLLEKTSTSTLV